MIGANVRDKFVANTYPHQESHQMSDHPDTNSFPEYEAAIACFSDLQKNLQSNLTQTYEHGQVELLIKKDGNELLRLLFQAYLDQRSKAEVKHKEVVGTDEKVRTHCRPRRCV